MPTLPAYVDAGLRERTPHGSKDFPIQYYADELTLCPDHTFPLHWHPELEFFVCRGRQVIVQANGVAMELEPGFGILINSNTVHSMRQPQGGPGCHCPNIVFSEELIAPVSSLVYQSYVKPLTGNAELPYILLRPDTPWQGEILSLLDRIFSLMQRYRPAKNRPLLPFVHAGISSPCHELAVQTALGEIWQLLYRHLAELPHTPATKAKHLLQVRMQKMLTFLYENFSSPISLNEIAGAANISKSEASRCFHAYLGTSPVDYLLRYRIEKSKELLLDSSKSIQEVSFACGFGSPGYFSRCFREQTGMTAAQYRRQ